MTPNRSWRSTTARSPTARPRSISSPARSTSNGTWLAARSGAFSAIVAVLDGDGNAGEVVGFASLSPYKERAAYRTTVEDSVYVHRDHTGRGIGRLLLSRLVDIARDSGFHCRDRPHRGGWRRVAVPARGVRLRPGRRRTPGRPQVRPLARRRRHADRAVNFVGREGFEPSKALAGRFTVCSLWPLGHRPLMPGGMVARAATDRRARSAAR